MEKNKKILNLFEEKEVMLVKKRSFDIYVRRSFFYIFICFIICGAVLVVSSSTIYKKQREVTEIKSKIAKETQELESLQLEILNLKGFDKVMEYATKLNMNPPKLGESIFVDLDKENFAIENQKEPDKPLLLKIYEKIFKKKA